MAIKGIEVGAWKLEDQEGRIRFDVPPTLHAEMLGLVALLPEHGKRFHSVYDLRSPQERGGSTLFTVRPIKAKAFEHTGFMNGVDLRFYQAVLVGNKKINLVSIFDGEFALHQPFEIAGGRKLHDWPEFLSTHPDHRPFPEDAPQYTTQRDLLEDIDVLAPVTPEGITSKLNSLRRYLVDLTVEPAAFERTAKELAFTY